MAPEKGQRQRCDEAEAHPVDSFFCRMTRADRAEDSHWLNEMRLRSAVWAPLAEMS